MKYTATIELVTKECGECHMVFAVPNYFEKQCLEDGKGWSCPNGHRRIYTENELEKLKKQLAQKELELIMERNAHASTNRKLTRTKNRVAKGICPCCNRQFVNLHRHMEGQHPDYTTAA